MSYMTVRDLRKIVPCFGTFTDGHPVCMKECDARSECKKEFDLQAAKVASAAKVKQPTDSELHKIFIDMLRDVFPAMRKREFPNQGILHEFCAKDGKTILRLTTNYKTWDIEADFISKNGGFKTSGPESQEDVARHVETIKRIVNQHG